MSNTKRNECLGELNAPTHAMLCSIRNNLAGSDVRRDILSISTRLIQAGVFDEAHIIDAMASALLAETCIYDLLDDEDIFCALIKYAIDSIDFNQIARVLLDEEQGRLLHTKSCEEDRRA